MKERITGWISLLGSIGVGIFLFSVLNEVSDSEFIFWLSLIAYVCSTALYIIWTHIGEKVDPAIEKIKAENELIKRQIEQKELKKKLEEY